MTKSFFHLFFSLIISLFFLPVYPSCALNLAIFPIDDLSENGMTLGRDLSRFIAKEISAKGIFVIAKKRVLSYMALERIREVGTLQSRHILAAKKDMAADLILLGSITQSRQFPPAIGLTLSLIRTSDGKTLWSNSDGITINDQLHLLAINQPESTADLYPILCHNILASWPDDLDFSAGVNLAGIALVSVENTSFLPIDSIMFTPKYVKPGQEVKCFIKFKTEALTELPPKVYVKVSGRVYLASSNDGVHFQTSWVGNDGGQRKTVKVAMAESQSTIFRGVIGGEKTDASYPITLVIDWQGKRHETFIGTYIVDSIPPEISLKMGGVMVNGRASFSRAIPVNIQWNRREPISRWEFSVRDSSDEIVLFFKGVGACPGSLFWNGRNQKNVRMAPGTYTIVLNVYDRAGNKGSAEESVEFFPIHGDIALELKKSDNGFELNINYEETIPLISWRLELWSSDNHLLELAEGSSLPDLIAFNLAPSSMKDAIKATVTVKDIFGQTTKKRIKDLLALVQKVDDFPLQEKGEVPNQWISDF